MLVLAVAAYSDNEIAALISCPKRISDPPKREMKLVGADFRNDAKFVSDGTPGEFLEVREDPFGLNYLTSYVYSALDDLTGVTQGTQSRTFLYDSLKRLTYSLQPEMNPAGSGATLAASYTYTNDGLPKARSDGNGVVTTWNYDARNRVTTETHAGDGGRTPYITRCYDGTVSTGDGVCSAPGTAIALGHGKMTGTRSNVTAAPGVVSTTAYTAFDEMGQVLKSEQATNGSQAYGFQYEYDLAGEWTGLTNLVTGRKMVTAYDYAGRPVSLTSMLSGATQNFVSGAAYAAHGAVLSAGMNQNGSPAVGWTESRSYNSRLQMTGVSAAGLNLGLTYFGSANNGNVETQTMSRLGKTWTQSYGYDGENRVNSAGETGQANEWSQTYGYTATGNRYVTASPNYGLGTFTPVAASNYDGGNHLAMTGLTYDSAGNQTQMGSGLGMEYDANGHMQSSTLNGLKTTYAYDAEGRRVLKATGSAATAYVYDAFGQLAMETGATTTTACTTCFLTTDALGSTRQVVDAGGVAVGCHDYLPFGEELGGVAGRSEACWTAGDTRLKFTGKERDAETVSSSNIAGLDYFGARYFSGAQGRFTSTDPEVIPRDIGNPQVWNKYLYTEQSPEEC